MADLSALTDDVEAAQTAMGLGGKGIGLGATAIGFVRRRRPGKKAA